MPQIEEATALDEIHQIAHKKGKIARKTSKTPQMEQQIHELIRANEKLTASAEKAMIKMEGIIQYQRAEYEKLLAIAIEEINRLTSLVPTKN